RIAMGSVPAVLGLSVLVGVAESLTSAYFLGELSNLIPFLLLIAVTLVRPGVLGPEERHRIRRAWGSLIRIESPIEAWYLWVVGAGVLIIPIIVGF
ncbi:MAG: hypothetical protein ABEI54_00080, partial [Candidatus Bipolaricaulia bacterium]